MRPAPFPTLLSTTLGDGSRWLALIRSQLKCGACVDAGVSRMKGFVQLALQYAKRGTDTIDPGVVIHIKLPVMVED